MTQDLLHSLNQIINRVASIVPTSVAAPEKSTHTGLNQQAQSALNHQLSTSRIVTNAENLELSLQGKHLIIGLPPGAYQAAQGAKESNGSPRSQNPLPNTRVTVPLTESQVKLIKQLLAQQLTPHSETLTVSIETLTNTQLSAHKVINIPVEQRNQIALALLVQANQLTLSGQVQPLHKSLATLLSLFVPPLDKVVSLPLQSLPNTLRTRLSELFIKDSTHQSNPELMLSSTHRPLAKTTQSSLLPPAQYAEVDLTLNKEQFSTKLNIQHVATQGLLKAINQLQGGSISLSVQQLTSIVEQIKTLEAKQFISSLNGTKQSVLLSPRLDQLTLLPNQIDQTKMTPTKLLSNTDGLPNNKVLPSVLRLGTASTQTDIALPNPIIKTLSQIILHSKSENMSPLITNPMTANVTHNVSANHQIRSLMPDLNAQSISTQSIRELLVNNKSNGSIYQSVNPIIKHILVNHPTTHVTSVTNLHPSSSPTPSSTTNPTFSSAAPSSEQLLAQVQELTQSDLAALVLSKISHRQPLSSSPQATLASSLASMVQISLASKLHQQLSTNAKHVAVEQQLNNLIAPHLASLGVQPINQKVTERNNDTATELIQGITRLLTGHRFQQSVSLEWQTQHPDSQYFTFPNFLSGSKQPIQLLIKHERQKDQDTSENTKQIVQQGDKWHVSLQFDIPTQDAKLLAKATLQSNTVSIALYGSSQALLDKINQHKQLLEQRLRQLGFSVDAQPAYQGILKDNLVDWSKPIRSSNEVSV